MTDRYHEAIPKPSIEAVFDARRETSRSAFQVLAKRGFDTERVSPHPSGNVMLGVSVETPERRSRLDWLGAPVVVSGEQTVADPPVGRRSIMTNLARDITCSLAVSPDQARAFQTRTELLLGTARKGQPSPLRPI